MQLELEGFNLANRRDSAIDYFYASRLAGESGSRATTSISIRSNRALPRLTLIKNW